MNAIMENLDWIAIVLTLIGCYLTATKSIKCWPCLLIANVFWIIHWNKNDEIAALILSVTYIGIGIYGWIVWKKEASG